MMGKNNNNTETQVKKGNEVIKKVNKVKEKIWCKNSTLRVCFFVSHSTVKRKLSCSPNQSETFGCTQKAAKQTPDLPHFSPSHPLPPHSEAGISCWWPSANAHSLTENLLWRWARETEAEENDRIKMHAICEVCTARALFYLCHRDRIPPQLHTNNSIKYTNVTDVNSRLDRGILRGW